MREDLDSILADNNVEALLLCADSYRDANMYYLTKFLAPDPFIFFKKVDAEPLIIVNQMEFPRAQKQSIVKAVKSYTDYNYLRVLKTAKNPQLGEMKFIAEVVKKEVDAETKICVPPNFPVIVADVLRGEGLIINPIFGIVEKARETKQRNRRNQNSSGIQRKNHFTGHRADS